MAEKQFGVLTAFAARVNSTNSAIRSVEAEVHTWGATTIRIIGAWQKHSVRVRNACTNDLSAVPVGSNVLYPWEKTIKIDWFSGWEVTDDHECVSGKPVQ